MTVQKRSAVTPACIAMKSAISMNDVLERTGGRMRLWPGMLYRALGRLADVGLIAEIEPPEDVAAAGGRPRFFRITAAGRRACAAEAERLAGFVELAKRKKLLKA